MPRYIDAEKIQYERHNNVRAIENNEPSYYDIAYKKQIDALPAADVEEVRHGRWIIIPEIKDNETKEKVVCSRCFHTAHKDFRGFIISDYCPDCGAKMDGGEE